MSGIAGIVQADGCDVSADVLDRIAGAAVLGGADGVATWREGPAGLIRFRHATTPEAMHERQPCPAASGNVIAFDGRLDNRAELLAWLGDAGMTLRARPDEEIALALFEARGDAFLGALTGDYALAIWQPGARRLFCARSPIGWRPFLYTHDARRFAFASEPRALVQGLALERRLNEPAIAEMLAQRQVTRGATWWGNIDTLPQGAALEYRAGRLRVWHWDTAPHEDWSRASPAAHVERFGALFDQALVACARSSTPVVAQLSGGLDSSSVLSRATALHRAGAIDRPVAAITARYPGLPVDESRWSGLVERHLGIAARVVSGGVFDPDEARAWTAHTLYPPLRPNTVDTMQNIFRDLQRRGERVLLSGEGGDELLNGNVSWWPDAVRRGRIDRVIRAAFDVPETTPLRALRSIVMVGLAPHLDRVRYRRVAWREPWAGVPLPDWLDADWLARTGLAARLAEHRPAVEMRTIAAQNAYAPIDMVARNFGNGPSAAYAAQCGVDWRHPFYDVRLLRFLLGAAGDVLFKDGTRRWLLREAMRGTLVEEVRTRRDKAVFNALTLDGLARLYETRPITSQWPVRLGWVEPRRLAEIWEAFARWRASDMTGPLPNLPFGALWNTAALDIWLEHAFGL